MEFRNGDDAAMGLGESNGAATLEAEAPAPKDKAMKMDRKDSGSEDLVAEAAAGALAEAAKATKSAKGDSKSVNPRRFRDQILAA